MESEFECGFEFELNHHLFGERFEFEFEFELEFAFEFEYRRSSQTGRKMTPERIPK